MHEVLVNHLGGLPRVHTVQNLDYMLHLLVIQILQYPIQIMSAYKNKNNQDYAVHCPDYILHCKTEIISSLL